RHNYQSSIGLNSSATAALAYRSDGKILAYTLSGSAWITDADTVERLSSNSGGGWTLITANDETETYDSAGRLVSIRNRAGVTQTLSYDSSRRLTQVADPFGHTLAFTYNAQDQISQMTDPAGGVYLYTYDTNQLNNLVSIQYPNLATRTFGYPTASKYTSQLL